MLTSREWASLILIGAAVVGLLIWPKTRSTMLTGLPRVLRSIHWKVVVSFLALLVWIAISVFLGVLAQLWSWDLLKDTVIITLTFAIPMMFRIPQAETGGAIVRGLIRDAIGFATLLEFYLNVGPLPLWAELLIQALVTFLVMLSSAAATKAEWAPVRKLTNSLVTLIALGAAAWSTVTIIRNWGSLEWPELLRSFLLTIWLPAWLLPFYYVEAFLMSTELIMVRLRFLTSDRKPPPRAVRLAVVIGLKFRVKLASRFDGRYNDVGRLHNFGETIRFMSKFRRDVHERDAAERSRVESLRLNAGKVGVDPDGAQLDRREFYATKNRLDWISVCESLRG